MFDVGRLHVLLQVIERGSVTAAAARLNYTPSAVSQQLRRLEREVGQPLLIRHARGMEPTEAGQVLAGHARKVIRQLTAAESDLQEMAGLRRGQLSIGTFATVGSSFVPIAVQRFRALYPSIRLNIHSAREAALLTMLEEGSVGLSLLWDYEWRRLDPTQFALTTLFEDPTVLVVAADHRLARKRQVSMADLAEEQWIIRAAHPVVEVLQRSAAAAGFEPRISFEANDYQEAQAMVSVGFGIALAPRTAMTNKHPAVRIIPLGDSAPPRRIVAAHRHDRVRAAAEIAFHEVLIDVARDYAPQV
ncbi:Transcriptional regulator, LysR family [Nostocoides australiense Ben110]|uniref:Transcriptional regulator, LysR family n=1 Tax=Nostocoides australiense Ben110 TaxID=1193182 RepID=W6JTK6_9MICO|nr:LysR family transcriptional regulator [Tetrasphaera australiensis]CCH71760.1 Transcriptional regulator, LysR family [Tetrasphaera australiensis Ben110]